MEVRTRRWLAALALVALAIVPYLPGRNGDFVGDDVPIVRERVELRSLGGIPALFGQTYWGEAGRGGLYRPLTLASFALDGAVWGRGPGGAPGAPGAHRTNLVLHALVSLLVLHVLRRRLRQAAASGGGERTVGAAAWLGAALFAVHPVHVEPVVHLVGRADLLAALFFLAALELHHAGARAARALAPLAYLAGMLSKEFAAVLPAVLLFEAWVDRPPGESIGAFARRQALALAPFVAAALVYLGARGAVLGAHADPASAWLLYVPGSYVAFPDPAPFEIAATMTHAFGEYLRLLVAPWRLSADYSGFPHHTGLAGPVWISAVAWIVVATAAAVAWIRREREPAFWLAFFAIVMLPVSNLIVASGVIVAERALYLASVAFVAALAWCALRLPRQLALGAGVFALAALAILSWRHAPVWSDARTLFEHAVEHGEHRGHVALNGLVGELLAELEQTPSAATLERALPLANEAVLAWPDASNAIHFARLLELAGRRADALRCWEGLRRDAPTDPLVVSSCLRLIDELLAEAAAGGDDARARRLLERGSDVARASGDGALAAQWAQRLASGQ